MSHTLVFAFLLIACTDSSAGTDAGPNPGDPDAVPAGWTELISGTWSLEPGVEGYRCAYLTVNEDLFISGVSAMIPTGTHHTVLTVGEPTRPDGLYDCEPQTNHPAMIYGSGIGTTPVEFPEGVAVRVEAGQQMLLNLHLLNVSDSMLEGTSGTMVRLVNAAEVVHEAEAILMGKMESLVVPPGESTQVGTCAMNGDVTLFAMMPHMHQYGTHLRVVARTQQADSELWNSPYSFDEQELALIAPIELAAGDEIDVHCTYDNTTAGDVGFGDSSYDEMCFAAMYRYPKFGGTYQHYCAN